MGPVVLRAEGHKNLLVHRNASMCTKDHSTAFAEVEKVPVRVPYVLIRIAVRKKVGALGKIKGRVKRRSYEALTYI